MSYIIFSSVTLFCQLNQNSKGGIWLNTMYKMTIYFGPLKLPFFAVTFSKRRVQFFELEKNLDELA